MTKNCFSGVVAVITGAASGIGRALAVELAAKGARLALADVDVNGLEETRRLCGEDHCQTYRVDVSHKSDVYGLADAVRNDFGEVHYLFNNAGVALSASIENSTLEEFEWITNINLWGVVYGTKAFLPLFTQQGYGHIVNISSVWGLVGYPGNGAYSMTKFAVRGLTETLWSELAGTGVYATCVHPGGTRTGMTDGVRMGQSAGEMERIFLQRQARGHTTTAAEAAGIILAGVASKKRRIVVSKGSRTAHILSRLMPSSYPFVMRMLGV